MGRDRIDLGMSAPNVRGRARVQLFGPSGECVRDEIKDNFVSERWLRAMAWFANWGAFANNTKTAVNTTTMSTATAFRELPFTGIALTDYDGAPDQDERLVRGKPLAHASKGVAGGGEARGTYNAEESAHEFAYHKLVFDFATNQANGSFQSIYTGFFNSANASEPPSRTRQVFGLTATAVSLPDSIVLRDENDILYRCRASQIDVIEEWTPTVYGSAPTIRDTVTLTPAAAHFSAFAVKGSRMYWLTATVSNERRIMSAPLSNLSDTRIERALTPQWAQSHGASGTGNVGGVNGFAYHPERDEFFISIDNTSTLYPQFAVMSLSPDTFADRDKWGAAGQSIYTGLAAYPGESGLIANFAPTGLKTRHLQLEDDGSITIVHESDCTIAPFGDSDIGFQSRDASATNYHLAPAQHFFSRALLDEPVEKTPQNTMKITYEFTFDEPVLP